MSIPLLTILKKEQKKHGYISEDIIKKISIDTGIPVSRIYGVASFYSMLHTEKQGKYIIEVCHGPSCHINNGDNILKIIQTQLKIKPGQTTRNKKFSLYTTSCIGCCDEAPALLLNGKPYTKLTKEKVISILKKCRS